MPNSGTTPNPEQVCLSSRVFVASRLAGDSQRIALEKSGIADSNPSRVAASEGVREAFRAVLIASGCTDEQLARRLAEGLDATVIDRKAVRKLKVSDTEEIIEYQERVDVDYQERRRAVELAAKLRDLEPDVRNRDVQSIAVTIERVGPLLPDDE